MPPIVMVSYAPLPPTIGMLLSGTFMPIASISAMSPIGKCLLNHEEGDEVEVRVPAGSKTYEVVRLITIHDRLRDEEGVDTDKAEIGGTAGGSEA